MVAFWEQMGVQVLHVQTLLAPGDLTHSPGAKVHRSPILPHPKGMAL